MKQRKYSPYQITTMMAFLNSVYIGTHSDDLYDRYESWSVQNRVDHITKEDFGGLAAAVLPKIKQRRIRR